MKENKINEIINNLYKATLKIPVLNGYQIIKKDINPIFVAKSEDNSVEQYLDDGQLNENETFEERIKKVIQETEQAMRENGLSEEKVTFLEEYKTNKFTFHLYLQDNIKDNKQVRQVNAYFVEPECRVFYEIVLAAPPLETKDINESVTKNILVRLKNILDKVDYS